VADQLAVITAARNEADRVRETVAALRATFPGAALWVADDASSDGTAEVAMAAGAQVVSRGRPHGKGANVGAAAEAALSTEPAPRIVLFCDGDLAGSAAALAPLVAAVERGECDLAVAAFSRRVGGGFGVALGFARWAIRRRCGLEASAPISGQRAVRVEALPAVLPFARGYGMEIGMTIDAVRAGYRLREYELDLSHRATGRSPAGFVHRARQLADFARVYLSRRRTDRPPPLDRGSGGQSRSDSSGRSGSREGVRKS
jgi:glycosyltransferase involved in cell wall biosynthesis